MKALTRVVRADLVIATLALLISAGATLSSLYQTKVIANQLSSSVWPYLTVESDTTTGKAFELSITNDGLGPALIGDATLSLDGKKLARYREGRSRIIAQIRKAGNRVKVLNASFSSLGPTTVIRAGETRPVLALRGSVIAYVGDLSQRVRLDLCYCSLLSQCWSERGQESRVPVARCSGRSGIDY